MVGWAGQLKSRARETVGASGDTSVPGAITPPEDYGKPVCSALGWDESVEVPTWWQERVLRCFVLLGTPACLAWPAHSPSPGDARVVQQGLEAVLKQACSRGGEGGGGCRRECAGVWGGVKRFTYAQ